jgi:hypothetical protein
MESDMESIAAQTGEKEVSILAGILGNGRRPFSHEIARYILDLDFSDEEKVRMHDLAVRNQGDALSAAEKEELFAFGKAGDVVSILKSKARCTLGIKAKQRSSS